MRIEIAPAPSDEERTAIEQVLETIATSLSPSAGAWWSQGVRENVTEEGDVSELIGPDRSGPYASSSS